MELVPFGDGSALVSRIGLGCSSLSPFSATRFSVAKDVVRQAIDSGVTFFETADSYGAGWSERWVGSALGSKRHQVMIATKCGQPATFARKVLTRLPRNGKSSRLSRMANTDRLFSPEYIESALLRSLRRLGTEYVDVLMLHSPPSEVLSGGLWAETLSGLRDRGLIRFFGISARSPDDAVRVIRDYDVDCVEIELNPCTAASSAPVLAIARSRGTAVIARQAFGSGQLLDAISIHLGGADAGKIRPAIASALRQFVLQLPGVSVLIVGMSSVAHVADNTSPSAPTPEFIRRVAEAARQVCAARAVEKEDPSR